MTKFLIVVKGESFRDSPWVGSLIEPVAKQVLADLQALGLDVTDVRCESSQETAIHPNQKMSPPAPENALTPAEMRSREVTPAEAVSDVMAEEARRGVWPD